ncbi:MAG: hypothetical protein WBO48_15700, partial [Candidatus Promineifilaceae bacterium]
AYAQYAAREDGILMATALLVQAELAEKMGAPAKAVDLLKQAQLLRQTVQRAMSPHEQMLYDALNAVLARP